MKLTSKEFENNENIPDKFTCRGENKSPSLNIEDVPKNAKSLVLIIDDPDAPMGTWDHWIVYNINPNISKIEEDKLPEGSVQVRNSFGKLNYGGPCPPSGIHRYFFKLYALDKVLEIKTYLNKEDLLNNIKENIIKKIELIGLYGE